MAHDFVIGELACGSLGNRADILSDLRALPRATMASTDEVMSFIDHHRLWGTGLGWADAHLLASALLSQCRLWTLDKKLEKAAVSLGVS